MSFRDNVKIGADPCMRCLDKAFDLLSTKLNLVSNAMASSVFESLRRPLKEPVQCQNKRISNNYAAKQKNLQVR